MNHVATSKEEIIRAGLKFASREGLNSLNIRNIAAECGISVGCVYRYFPSKADLISAAVEKIWEEIFHSARERSVPDDFRECVRLIFSCIQNGCAEYPSFFRQHSTLFAESGKDTGRRVMNEYLEHIRDFLLQSLLADHAVRQNVFDNAFTQGAFADFIFENLLSMGVQQYETCDYLICLIEKLIY